MRGFSRILDSRPQSKVDKVFNLKYARIFTNSGLKTTKKRFLLLKSSQTTVLVHEFLGDNQYFRSLRPRTALQWHRASNFLWGTILALGGHNSRLGGGEQAVIWGARPRNAPRGAGPECNMLKTFALKNNGKFTDHNLEKLCPWPRPFRPWPRDGLSLKSSSLASILSLLNMIHCTKLFNECTQSKEWVMKLTTFQSISIIFLRNSYHH